MWVLISQYNLSNHFNDYFITFRRKQYLPWKTHILFGHMYTHVHTQNGNNKDTLIAIS